VAYSYVVCTYDKPTILWHKSACTSQISDKFNIRNVARNLYKSVGKKCLYLYVYFTFVKSSWESLGQICVIALSYGDSAKPPSSMCLNIFLFFIR